MATTKVYGPRSVEDILANNSAMSQVELKAALQAEVTADAGGGGGSAGATGLQGIQGATGVGMPGQGATGLAGIQGATGLAGVGSQGATGVVAPSSAVVYDRLGAISDPMIFDGAVGLNGTTGINVSLPNGGFSNTNYKVQATYMSAGFNPTNAGFLYVQVISTNTFTIFSSNPLDGNNVMYLATGSIAS